jgi:hypothetical protein
MPGAPPPPPSDYVFHEAEKDDKGRWGAWFTVRATGKKFFAHEERIRELNHKNEQTNKPDAEIAKAVARLEAAKLSESDENGQFTFDY